MSRARHDRELAALERLLAIAEKARDDARQDALDAMRLHELERRRYDELLTQFMAMRLKGAEVIPVAGGLVEPQAVPPDSHAYLKALIAEKAGKNYALRGAMLRQLSADLAAGDDPAVIEQRILNGVETQGVPA